MAKWWPWRGRRCCRQCSEKARESRLCVPKGKERETTKKQPASPSLRALCFPGWSLGRDAVSRLHRVPSAPTRAKGDEKAAETRGHREEPTGRNSAQQSQVLLLLSSTGGAAQSQRAQDTRDPKPRMFTKQEHKEQHNAGRRDNPQKMAASEAKPPHGTFPGSQPAASARNHLPWQSSCTSATETKGPPFDPTG